MYEQKELVCELLDTEVVGLILNLRAINEEHITGSSTIDYLSKIYDAQIVCHALTSLETVAKENNLEIKQLTADSSLDELLGNVDSKWVVVKATLSCWNLFSQVSKE
jgi:hypothetical protein